MASSTPGRRNVVRVLFYGQSITEQKWADEVTRSLRARFPHAELIVENRSLGGYASQLLVKTAETDLYSFYPDLLIFHVYGAHDKYEDIIRRVRERTTAEILMQTDHVTKSDELREETSPSRIDPEQSPWSTFMNQRWLPELSRRYQTALCDQRASWKRYLTAYGLSPSALLADEVHLNAHGEWLMAGCVKDCLRRDRALGTSPAQRWVRTYWIGRDVDWQAVDPERAGVGRGAVLRVRFEGNRVDAVFAAEESEASGPLAVLIDGKPPSAWPELYGLTRALPTPGGKWPALFEIGAQGPRIAERWTMTVETLSRDPERYAFHLRGSVTGPDGAGRSDEPFVSRSGRVTLEPSNWGVAYAMGLAGVSQVPDVFTIGWDVVPRYQDQAVAPISGRRGVERVLTLAQGLPNGSHVLELRGDPAGLRGVRVYRPPQPTTEHPP